MSARLESLRSVKVFPGRHSLHPREVARALSISTDQVAVLKEQNLLEGISIGIGTDHCRYRITVASYDAFIVNGGTQHVNRHTGHSKNGKHHSNGAGLPTGRTARRGRAVSNGKHNHQ